MIPNESNLNLGGVTAIKLVMDSDIANFNSKNAVAFIILNNGVSWFNAYFSQNTCKVECNKDDDGLFPISILFKCPNDRIDLYNSLISFENKKVVVQIEFSTGVKKVYGTKDNPLIFSSYPVNGPLSQNYNGFEIKITGKDFIAGRYLSEN